MDLPTPVRQFVESHDIDVESLESEGVTWMFWVETATGQFGLMYFDCTDSAGYEWNDELAVKYMDWHHDEPVSPFRMLVPEDDDHQFDRDGRMESLTVEGDTLCVETVGGAEVSLRKTADSFVVEDDVLPSP